MEPDPLEYYSRLRLVTTLLSVFIPIGQSQIQNCYVYCAHTSENNVPTSVQCNLLFQLYQQSNFSNIPIKYASI
jgi:hypothetical protein